MNKDLLEKLADLEHQQWMAWSKAVAREVHQTRRSRWEKYWVSYKDLSEEIKEHDRKWARKILELPEIKRALEAEEELLELAADVWLQWGYSTGDGGRFAGGLSILEFVESILRRYGKIDDKGKFQWEYEGSENIRGG